MRFSEVSLLGAYLIEVEESSDERGSFGRTFCRREYQAHGLNPDVAQRSTSVNPRAGTLRGMHYQLAPHAEAKTIRCTRGAIFDVIVDLRADSPTYLQWFGIELSAQNRKLLYVPPGLAHGFESLTAQAEVDYQMSEEHRPELGRGIRWDDPAFGIRWPLRPQVMSVRDRDYPDFQG